MEIKGRRARGEKERVSERMERMERMERWRDGESVNGKKTERENAVRNRRDKSRKVTQGKVAAKEITTKSPTLSFFLFVILLHISTEVHSTIRAFFFFSLSLKNLFFLQISSVTSTLPLY